MKPTDIDAGLKALFTRPGFRSWKSKVASVHGCAAPIKLRGSSTITHKITGQVLKETVGSVWAPCGTRREALCPACSQWYAEDAFHLIRSGLDGDTAKGISADVATRPRYFATLTPPSFGPVHSRVTGAGGKLLRPCSCGEWHREADTRLGQAIDLASYDFEAAVLWQAHAGKLWHRFTIALRRRLAHAAGMTVTEFKETARLSYAKVAEYQRRGLVHFHAAIRLDGSEGAATRPPAWATKEALADAIRTAAASVVLEVPRRNGEVLELRFGSQLDLRDITAAAAGTGDVSEEEDIRSSRLASYIAKYATKSTGAHEGPDRKLRSVEDIERLEVSAHHKAMMRTAWELGGLPEYAELNLRRWAHMLGFRGHFLTKSRAWSTTLGELRSIRARFRLAETLAALDVTADDVIVVNDWEAVGFGHDTDAEREYAEAIAEQLLERKLNRDNRKDRTR
ncbi:replication initiator [Glycomyces paridis]|uniref:Replication initiation protein n=1 Tax=Glycomyces paridis TaxID=2126555 RepID=A0A4S8PHD9_9ACTN|nr:replication initiator [Glycomyces paridis]THV30038.1 replication initiation protein [Glycomyces paridis]